MREDGGAGDESTRGDCALQDVIFEDGDGDGGVFGVPELIERCAGDVLKGLV